MEPNADALPGGIYLDPAVENSQAWREDMHACKILIIDDEAANVRLMERVLARAGFRNVVSTTDSRTAVALFIEHQPDLVLTDWLMPEVDGCAVIKQLRAITATDDFLPIVVLTADITPQTRRRALTAGTTDFLNKPCDQIEMLLRIQNLLKARLSHLIIQAHNASLEKSVRLRTMELETALTELKASHQQVIQQERLAALGTMAGGIAHDFNNALGVIMGFTELLLRDAAHGLAPGQATAPLTTILTAAEDGAKIVHRLRNFYRPDTSDEPRLPLDLNKLVEQAIALTQPRWHTAARASGRAITVTSDLGQIGNIAGDPAELREILTNLIFNAVDALPAGGSIVIGTRCEGETVALTIRDSGIGMSEEVRQRCLEPFFTTKGRHGTGLGLSMVFGIVQRHGGALHIDSEPDHGTVFTLRFPTASDGVAVESETYAPSHEPLHILVVDDQPILNQLLGECLRADFHTVETALGGPDALEKFRAGKFDLVITDHVMAGMTGEQLAVEMKELDPSIRVMLHTGYGGGSALERAVSGPIDLVLGKPVSRAALRQAVVKVMAARR